MFAKMIGATLIGILALLWSKKASAATAVTPENIPMTDAQTADNLDNLFQKWGNRYGVDPLLLKAVAIQESSLNPVAVRNNPPHDISVGIMQILCIPDTTGKCTNRFNVDGWDNATSQGLLDPDFNISIGAQVLAWNLETYGYPRGIAVYNNWSARTSPENGPFPNQYYVDRVLANLAKIQGAQ